MNSNPTNLNMMLDATVAQAAQRPALVTETGSMTYGELRGQVLKAAGAFRAAGIKKEDRVAICLRNSPDFVIAYFGLLRLGAIVVPINFMIKKVAELEYMFKDSETAGIITQTEFLPSILETKKSMPSLRMVWSVDSEDAAKSVVNFKDFVAKAQPEPDEPSDLPTDTISTILYTSGTTGNPKGVMLTHGNLVSNCTASIDFMHLRETDVVLCILPMFHTFAWTVCALLPIRLGMKSVIMANITPPKPWLSMMAKHGVTLFIAIPPIYSVLAREAHGLKGLVLRYWFFRKVRLCISGAAPISTDIISDFTKGFGVSILEGYGLTETSPVATINPESDPRPGTVGVPLPGVHVKIVDDNEKPLELGQEGEVCIQGPNVMKGYFRKPEETRATFTSDGWFKSGDIGTLDKDGYLTLRGRKKDMIIVKGLKVFAAQVEQVIVKNALVEEAAVIGIPDQSGNEIIKVFIVLKQGVQPDANTKSTLMQFFRDKLDAYKRPRDVEFLAELPKNSMQKVLKRVLLQKEIEKKS